ncbi:MAG: 6-carboxytetrahydropterin synthase QueD [candidate division WS1 bacterium]|jgi:6-pyruvoyltetrahydropterin/6-carboxytetrahydropterin synthase|nr:6-carboxytetrahydropterin synthase QueD [candidate division WS1 bacterium]
MFELTVERTFSAAHHLEDYAGPCARLHGHNYRVLATFRGEKLNVVNFVVDFSTLKQLCEQALAPLDHQCLNHLSVFSGSNPTAEALALYVYRELQRLAADQPVRVAAVTVYESDNAAVTYRED